MLEDVTSHRPAPDRQPFVVINALALLSLLTGEDGDDERAMALARQAMDVAEAQGARYDPMTGVAYIALARATARRGGLAEAEQLLDEGLQVLGNDSYAVQHAQAMVELVVLRLLATKLSQPEIAQELYVSVNTVRTHTQGIYRKLGVASRQEAIAAAREHGLLART